jgi:hypothetical protein
LDDLQRLVLDLLGVELVGGTGHAGRDQVAALDEVVEQRLYGAGLDLVGG